MRTSLPSVCTSAAVLRGPQLSFFAPTCSTAALSFVANFLDLPDVSLKSSVVALAERYEPVKTSFCVFQSAACWHLSELPPSFPRVDALSEDSLGELERQLVSVGKQLDEMKDKQAALMGQSPEHADKVCVSVIDGDVASSYTRLMALIRVSILQIRH